MRFLGFVVGWVLGLVVLAGCRPDLAEFHNTGGSGGSSTTSTGSGGDIFPTGGSGGAPVCGSCVQSAPVPFERLTMFSIGAPGDVRECPPDVAPLVGFEGFADLKITPPSCPECSCSPAFCALPEAMHVSAAKCPGDGAPSVEWSAGPGWEGVCTDEDAIPAGILCGGVPCTQSLTVSAPAIEPCLPSAQGSASIPDPSWGTMVRECLIGPLAREDCTPGEVCAPTPPEGFALCFFVKGDEPEIDCPDGFERKVRAVEAWHDDRACAPCACGEAEGADCEAEVSVFKDGACGVPLASYTLTSAMDDGCVDLPPGAALGSKSAVFVVDEPGSCLPSGGEVVGAVTPTVPVTLCCQPETEPAE